MKEVEEVKLIGLEITMKTEYQIGGTFDTDSLVVTAVYSDGTKRILESEEYEISGFDSSKAGEAMVTIIAGDVQEDITVNITEKKPEKPGENEKPGGNEKPDDKNGGQISSSNKGGSNNSGKNTSSAVKTVKTGDNAPMALWIAAGILSFGIIVVLAMKKGRKFRR